MSQNKEEFNKKDGGLIPMDYHILKHYHRFQRNDTNQEIIYRNQTDEEYGLMLAKKYYDKLYKEFTIVDLTYWKIGTFFF